VGHIDKDWRDYLERAKYGIKRAISANREAIGKTIKVYDDAYANLTFNSKPLAFREFLLDAPLLFAELGERLGVLNHIHHFWRFRFPQGIKPTITIEEFVSILVDFELSLNQPRESASGKRKPNRPSSAIDVSKRPPAFIGTSEMGGVG
jgi:hypothetical protein